ncbi:hypothetical protein D9611_010171 [Ephemerocybe angulata]|uniref:Fungal-type protein kinase domain-containing protein n=1 Tax=Ephemerocybe angulata TaxID=980116 RepID=A0A8H5EV56_9AGAR|nr:hypothetical protein D9611_010171 [Tulosesus angulatus]
MMTRPDTPNSRRCYSPCSSNFSEHSYYTTNENDSTLILEENLADSIHTDVDLLEFVKIISGLDRTVSERVLSLPFSLDDSEVNCYKTEGSLRQASLAAIIQKLFYAVQEGLKIRSEFLTQLMWPPTCGDKSAVMITCGSAGTTNSTILNWRHTAKCIPEILHQAELAGVAPGPILASNGGDCPIAVTCAQASSQPNDISLLAAKRRRSVSIDSTLDEHIEKRQRIVDYKVEEIRTVDSFLQLASLASTYLASTTRLWVSGLVVDKDCKVTAAYYDRQLVVYSAPFHFDEDPAKLAVVVYAMSYGCRKADLDQHLSASHLPVADPGANVTELCAQLSFPCLKLGHPTSHEPRRVLRIIAAPYYQKLWEAGSVENFQKVWLECVYAHHEAWQRSGALHQDLSEHTLQVLHLNGEMQGILKDWDTSPIPKIPARLSPTYIPAGTPIFMAREMLAPFVSNPTHWYRHNLEAFFYILVWAAVHYDMELKTRDEDVHPSLRYWALNENDASYNLQSIAISKLTFVVPGISNLATLAFRFIRRKPGFEPLLEEWILPLRKLLNKARKSIEEGLVESEEGLVESTPQYDHSTCGGQLTFETFMATLGIQAQK